MTTAAVRTRARDRGHLIGCRTTISSPAEPAAGVPRPAARLREVVEEQGLRSWCLSSPACSSALLRPLRGDRHGPGWENWGGFPENLPLRWCRIGSSTED